MGKDKKTKEILTKKKYISFYKECYEKLGYQFLESEKIDNNYVVRFRKAHQIDWKLEENVEKKLRILEVYYRKKYRYGQLCFHLLLHVFLFLLQGFVLYQLHLEKSHPKIMLEVGCGVFFLILFICFMIKMIEIFRWNRTITRLKNSLFDFDIKKPIEEFSNHIAVLFTRNHSFISNLIYFFSGREFTHASIGFGDCLEEFYSFDYRGFRSEHPSHRSISKNSRQSVCYLIRVSDRDYIQLKNTISEMKKEKNTYRYNYIGVLFSTFHIYMPIKTKKVYFCSEFVSEELIKMDSIHLKRKANMYLPTNLAKSLILNENLEKVLVNII